MRRRAPVVHGGGGRGWRAAPGVRQRPRGGAVAAAGVQWWAAVAARMARRRRRGRAAVDDGGRHGWRWRDPDGLAGPVMGTVGLSWVFLFLLLFLFD